jgi:glycosyltransferase involved in cell wall biosynthesis
MRVVILTSDGEAEELSDGIRIVSSTRKPVGRLRSLTLATWIFQKAALSINADVYQVHSPELLPLAVRLRRLGKRVVYDAHEDMPKHILEKEWLPSAIRPLISKTFATYQSRAVSELDAVISPHSHVVEGFQESGIDSTLIANFPLVDREHPVIPLNVDERAPLICYTGTVYRYSNQENICEAVNELEGVKYAIAGFIDDNHRKVLEGILPPEKFSFLGRLSQRDLAAFYRRCSIGVVVYDYKLNLGWRRGSFGTNKIFEYMEAGLPIICTDFELWADIVSRFDCGICVPPGDKTAIKDAIRFLVENPERAVEMGINGRQAVLREFNWTNEESKYVSLVKRLVNLDVDPSLPSF